MMIIDGCVARKWYSLKSLSGSRMFNANEPRIAHAKQRLLDLYRQAGAQFLRVALHPGFLPNRGKRSESHFLEICRADYIFSIPTRRTMSQRDRSEIAGYRRTLRRTNAAMLLGAEAFGHSARLGIISPDRTSVRRRCGRGR
jgi:hypothetical protein